MKSTTENSTTVQARALPDPNSNHVSTVESHDGAALNLSHSSVILSQNDERATLDRGELESNPRRFIKCKKPTIISTLNTRTLNPAGREDELILHAKSNNIDVISIQGKQILPP